LDIGETVKRATAAAADLGVTFLSVHATGQTVRAAVEGRGRSAVKILAVTVLTSFDEADLVEMGIVESVRDTVLKRARLATSLGGPYATPQTRLKPPGPFRPKSKWP